MLYERVRDGVHRYLKSFTSDQGQDGEMRDTVVKTANEVSLANSRRFPPCSDSSGEVLVQPR